MHRIARAGGEFNFSHLFNLEQAITLDLMKNYLVGSLLLALLSVLSLTTHAAAQSVGVLCMNNATKVITIEKSCTTAQTRLSGRNLPISNSIINSRCYTQTGKVGNASSSGKISVALSCRSSDVVVSDGFDVESNVRANPKLSSKTLIFGGSTKAPTGVVMETQGEPNLYYALSAQIVCCPTL
jgi:hypothetical protein